MPDKVSYTPAEFAALFGKERTWGYRQIYAGKVNAVTVFGSIMIPVEEVEKAMKGASRYGVSGNAVKRRAEKKTQRKIVKEANSAWKKHLLGIRQMQDNSLAGSKSLSSLTNPIARGSQHRSAIIRRLTRKASRAVK